MEYDVNSLEFWTKVQKEIEREKPQYLCVMSINFFVAWKSDACSEIRKLGHEFIESLQQDIFFACGDSTALFGINNVDFDWNEFYQLRPDFVNWCVARFSKS